MDNRPFFSIVIPSYNRANFISKTINSVLSQTFKDFECIIIDDGSTDNTKEIVITLLEIDNRVKYYHQLNSERCIARNNGINHAKGKYICFLDSDDLFLENHLEVIYTFLEAEQFPKALVFTDAFNLEEDNLLSERYCPPISNDVQSYILNYTFNPARVAIHHSILTDEFRFDPYIPGLEDLELWLRISLFYPILQIKERTIIYNLHDETYTLGDSKRYLKELEYFKYIFSKKELKRKLPLKEKRRLLSMCYFHLSTKQFNVKNRWMTIKYSLLSFLYYPQGYNGKTNKIVLYQVLKSMC